MWIAQAKLGESLSLEEGREADDADPDPEHDHRVPARDKARERPCGLSSWHGDQASRFRTVGALL